MTARRVFRGHIDRAKSNSLRTGGRQRALVVMVEPEDGAALEAALPEGHLRARSIPIAFVIGDPGEDLAVPEAEPAAPAAPPPELLEEIRHMREAVSICGDVLDALREDQAHDRRQLDVIAGILGALKVSFRFP